MSQDNILETIREKFISELTDSNDPDVFIMKPFLRYYVIAQLQKIDIGKQMLTGYDIGLLTAAIKNLFGSQFKHQRKLYQRFNKSNIFGLQLSPKLQQIHESFRVNYLQERKRRDKQLYQRRRSEKLSGNNLYRSKVYIPKTQPRNSPSSSDEQKHSLNEVSSGSASELSEQNEKGRRMKVDQSLLLRVRRLQSQLREMQMVNRFLVKRMGQLQKFEGNGNNLYLNMRTRNK